MFKNNKIILPLFFLFFTAQLFAQVIEEAPTSPPPVFEEIEMDFSIDDSKSFTPPAEIPRGTRRKKHNGRYGFYGSGIVVIPFIYDDLPKEFSDLMIAKKGNKFGAINKRNQEVVPFVYDKIYKIYENYFKLKQGKNYGILDKNGSVTIPVEYTYLERWKKEVLVAGPKNGKYGLLDYVGNEVHSFTFENRPVFAFENHYIIKVGGKTGMTHVDGNMLVPLEYERMSPTLYNNYVAASKNGKYGLLDKKGKKVLPFEYDEISEKKDGTFIVTQNKLQGLLDANFQVMIPTAFDELEMRNDKHCLVRKNRLSGVVDLKGNEVLPCEYSKIHMANGDVFVVAKKGERIFSIINKKGERVIEDDIANAKSLRPLNFFAVQKVRMGQFALFNADLGEIVTDFHYDDLRVRRKKGTQRKELEIRFIRDGRMGVLSETGVEQNSTKIKK